MRPYYAATPIMLLILSGCVSNWDMQGTDPKDYYAQNPIDNKVETRQGTYIAHFAGIQSRLSPDEQDKLRDALGSLSPDAMEHVQIEVSSDVGSTTNMQREDYLKMQLAHMGYDTKRIQYVHTSDLDRNDVRISMTYAAVVSPNCPDWRTSPVTTFSNTTQANYSCAFMTDIGLMVADPHDLAKGHTDVQSDTATATKAISDYRNGVNTSASTTSASSSGSSATSASPSSSTGQ